MNFTKVHGLGNDFIILDVYKRQVFSCAERTSSDAQVYHSA